MEIVLLNDFPLSNFSTSEYFSSGCLVDLDNFIMLWQEQHIDHGFETKVFVFG